MQQSRSQRRCAIPLIDGENEYDRGISHVRARAFFTPSQRLSGKLLISRVAPTYAETSKHSSSLLGTEEELLAAARRPGASRKMASTMPRDSWGLSIQSAIFLGPFD